MTAKIFSLNSDEKDVAMTFSGHRDYVINAFSVMIKKSFILLVKMVHCLNGNILNVLNQKTKIVIVKMMQLISQ